MRNTWSPLGLFCRFVVQFIKQTVKYLRIRIRQKRRKQFVRSQSVDLECRTALAQSERSCSCEDCLAGVSQNELASPLRYKPAQYSLTQLNFIPETTTSISVKV